MNRKIKDLFNQEELIELTLSNCLHQVKLYQKQLERLDPKQVSEKEYNQFKNYFEFYEKDLIPAIQEIAELDKKHLDLINKNPDPFFTPILEELEMHKKMVDEFVGRFEQIHEDFFVFYKKNK